MFSAPSNLGQNFALDQQLAVLVRAGLPAHQYEHGERNQHEGQQGHEYAEDEYLLGAAGWAAPDTSQLARATIEWPEAVVSKVLLLLLLLLLLLYKHPQIVIVHRGRSVVLVMVWMAELIEPPPSGAVSVVVEVVPWRLTITASLVSTSSEAERMSASVSWTRERAREQKQKIRARVTCTWYLVLGHSDSSTLDVSVSRLPVNPPPEISHDTRHWWYCCSCGSSLGVAGSGRVASVCIMRDTPSRAPGTTPPSRAIRDSRSTFSEAASGDGTTGCG
uniref:Uncharacterized protein n=1 Tax=Anopheles melas TaxID=34690 RepID=A0A182U9F6_9DIPT